MAVTLACAAHVRTHQKVHRKIMCVIQYANCFHFLLRNAQHRYRVIICLFWYDRSCSRKDNPGINIYLSNPYPNCSSRRLILQENFHSTILPVAAKTHESSCACIKRHHLLSCESKCFTLTFTYYMKPQ